MKRKLLFFVLLVAVLDGWAQGARLSLAYVGKTTTYNDAIGLPNISTNRVELSLIYRIKIF
jgi:hypothetical protein